MTTLGTNDVPMSHKLASLPTRLCDWRISSDQETFACGGDEVELSVWNTEQVFSPPQEQPAKTETNKRKRGDALFPGELWRAKNVRTIYFHIQRLLTALKISRCPMITLAFVSRST